MQLHRRGAPLVLLLATGCKGCQSTDEFPALLEAEDATPVGVWVAEALGTSPAAATIYTINALGAPVPGGDVTWSAGAISGTATPDAGGWASAEVAVDIGRYALTANAGDVAGEGVAWVTEAAPGQLDAAATRLAGPADVIALAGDGVVSAVGGEVWWAPLDGGQPARVLALEDAVTQLTAVYVDSDGVPDLLVTSDAHVVLLRGRAGGGLTWGAGWTAAAGSAVAGASVRDFDGDAAADLGVAMAAANGTTVLIFAGDGGWSFQGVDSLDLPYTISALGLDDIDADGLGELTLVTEDGLLRRYTKLDGSWAQTLAGSQHTLEFGAGGRLLPSVDLDGDGYDDLVTYGPSASGAGWLAWIISMGESSAGQYAIVGEASEYPWLGFATADLDGDGAQDFIYTAPDRVARGWWRESTEDPGSYSYFVNAYTDVPAHPALALGDVDGDTLVDVALGGAAVRVLEGERVADTVAWRLATPDVEVFGLQLILEPVLTDVTGDAVVDVVAVVQANGVGGVAFKGAQGVPASESGAATLRAAGSASVSTAGIALDFAVCDTRAWVLYEEADDTGDVGTWLARATLGASANASLDGSPVRVDGTQLACGIFPSGDIAVADPAGAVSFVDEAGNITAGDSIGAVGALAAADIDGDGFDNLLTCADDGCWIGAADMDGDGDVEQVTSGADGITLTVDGVAHPIDLVGAPRLSDADGDGLADLVVGDNGLVQVVRVLGGEPTPVVASSVWRPVSQAVRFGDLDGDGVPDAFLAGEDRFPDSSPDGDSWLGTLVYAQASGE
jgi:hypothetical protein